MIGDYRLPDPPPDLRNRILSGAEGRRPRLRPALLVGGGLFLATIAAVVLFSSAEGPAPPGKARPIDSDRLQERKPFDPYEPPDSIRCTAALSQKNPDQCTLRYTEFKGTRKQQRAVLKVQTGKWARIQIGDTITATVISPAEEGRDPAPKEIEILESGICIVARTSPAPRKSVTLTTRVYFFKERAVIRTYAYDGDVSVGPGGTTVYILKAVD